jgi:hypothetical protein
MRAAARKSAPNRHQQDRGDARCCQSHHTMTSCDHGHFLCCGIVKIISSEFGNRQQAGATISCVDKAGG